MADNVTAATNDKVIRVSRAIASGCYDELLEKEGISLDQYLEKYAHLFVAAARKAIAELEREPA